MMSRRYLSGLSKQFVGALLVGLALSAAAQQPVQAESLDKLNTSLKWIPADAAFYSSMLRNREQVELAAKSKAWAKLKTMPSVQWLLSAADAQLNQPGGQLAPLRQMLDMPENRQLLDLLADMMSDEVFVYGDKDYVSCTALLMRVASTMRYGSIEAELRKKDGQQNQDEIQARLLLNVLSENLDDIKVPVTVVGFKLSDGKRAEAQVARLEKLLQGLAASKPELKDRLARKKIGGDEFLTLALDGKLAPWDKIPWKRYEEKPGQYDKVIEKLRNLQLTICLGVHRGYLLLVCGPTAESLASMQHGPRLVDRPELKKLAPFAEKRLSQIAYVGQAMCQKLADSRRDIDELVKLGDRLLPLAKLTDQQNARIRKDVAALANDIKKMLPEVGAVVGFEFLTERGVESYKYNWGKFPSVDGSKPLALLNHVGGTPLLAVACRSKYSPEHYATLVKWLKVGHGYFEELAIPRMKKDDAQTYKMCLEMFRPWLARLDEVNRTMLLPALADGEVAFVLDAKATSRQWCKHMPASEQPMPMIEPALVWGVSDAALLKKARLAYRELANEAIAKAHALNPNDVPEFKIPEPTIETTKAGKLCWYPLPEKWGVDKQVTPSTGLGDHVAAVSGSKEQTERLLTNTPLKARGILAEANRPLVMAFWLDWPAMVDAAAPWVEMGARAAAKQAGLEAKADQAGPDPVTPILEQVRTVMEVLKVIRSVSAVVYFEDGVMVTHAETEIRDL
jgi:hypothetical protein